MDTQKEFLSLLQHLQQFIVGQHALLDRMMISLLTGGHILLEGPPGLAKTTAVRTLAEGVHAKSQRIQFTPDLMPGDLTGTDIFDPKEGNFRFVPGPIFNEIILADEINRAPPKVQSALLEAMQEKQVTVNGVTRALPELFIVMATQNPLEQMGTYPLPEAQLDRFLLQVVITYPSEEEELLILQKDRELHFGTDHTPLESPLTPETVLQARKEVSKIHVDPGLEKYIVELVSSTRKFETLVPEMKGYIETGASPRASMALLRASTAHAYLQGRSYVTPDDIIEIAPDVLRHRIIPGYAAQANQVDRETLIQKLIDIVSIP